MVHIFYWFFLPQIYVMDWKAHMVKSIIAAVIIIAFALLLYRFLPYRREHENRKFWSIYIFSLVFALGYIIYQTTTIPDEISPGSYKFLYVLNFIVALAVYELLLFWLLSGLYGAKKYFCRFNEYLRKSR